LKKRARKKKNQGVGRKLLFETHDKKKTGGGGGWWCALERVRRRASVEVIKKGGC